MGLTTYSSDKDNVLHEITPKTPFTYLQPHLNKQKISSKCYTNIFTKEHCVYISILHRQLVTLRRFITIAIIYSYP